MKTLGFAILLTALVSPGDQPLRDPVTLQVIAVHATNENHGKSEKVFDSGLENVRKALEGLSFDTFHKLKSTSKTVKPAETADIEIDDTYTLHVTPVAKDSEERFRVSVVIDETIEKDGKKETREALNATCAVVPGKHLVLGGLNMPKGQLVLLLSIAE
ncbi:MAG: hypothetical protein K1Y02_22020 [Candidatus Hydrogenedentes bacterium]|nr:hypothetical protein [Candidatus Hydrogenedentota bacterium]